eukprot:910209-Pleurochrysis_carterae.AAC.2
MAVVTGMHVLALALAWCAAAEARAADTRVRGARGRGGARARRRSEERRETFAWCTAWALRLRGLAQSRRARCAGARIR